MYAPIPDVQLVEQGNQVGFSEGETPDHDHSVVVIERREQDEEWTLLLVLVRRFLWRAFLGSFAFACLVFGTFIGSFYLQSLIRNQMDAWDYVDPGLYRKDDRYGGNWGLGIHFVGGAYLMLLGPLQFVPQIRKHYMELHRYNGRLCILVGTLGTSLGGCYYVGSVGSANVGIIGQSANYNNLIFGLAMLICGLETYRHAAFTKRIDQHKLWAYRIAALGFGGIYIRIGTSLMTVWLKEDGVQNSKIFQCGLNFLVCTNHIPLILLANEIWKLEQRGEAPTSTILVLALAALGLVLFVSGIVLLMLVAWIPFIGHNLDFYK